MSSLELSLVARARAHGNRPAISDSDGTYSYSSLLDASARVATALLDRRADLEEARVTFLVPPGFGYVSVQWGIWRAGGIAVPLATSHPPAEWEYVIGDADPDAVVTDASFANRLRPIAARLGVPFFRADQLPHVTPQTLPPVGSARRAMMVYTSGTTGRPKGVVTTHANIEAQVTSLVEAWRWSAGDRILLALPLHHVHGIINVLTCALWAGAVCDTLPRFDAADAWHRIARGDLTLFMAVPTMYRRLIAAWETASPEERRAMTAGARRMRLMVSGSAALPAAVMERWRAITGHVLLERYGMTEIGMALSNPLEGERQPGYVGTPLPGVSVRLVDEAGDTLELDGTPGEIEVSGPAVFHEYWRRPAETEDAFHHGWFRTGDVAVRERGAYRILGRSSVDIIKTGGYKVSALEIEDLLRTHPAVAECAVVGVPDPEWGERICAAVELAADATLTLDELQAWARERLAPYKLPRALQCVTALPRNALGKVTKPDVAAAFGEDAP